MTTPPTTTTPITPATSTTSKAKDYGELKISELVAMINTEYAAVIEAERTTLQRAISIGEKLLDLKPRVAKHGEWQQWLKDHCPKISLETANLYMRLADPDNLAKLKKSAADKSVSVTDLTLTEARNILAKPKQPKTTTNANTSPTNPQAAVEPPDSPSNEDVGKEWLKVLAPDELVAVLREFRDDEYLRELSKALSKVLSPPPTQAAAPTAGIAGIRMVSPTPQAKPV